MEPHRPVGQISLGYAKTRNCIGMAGCPGELGLSHAHSRSYDGIDFFIECHRGDDLVDIVLVQLRLGQDRGLEKEQGRRDCQEAEP